MSTEDISNSDFAKLFDEANEVKDYSISELISSTTERYVNFEPYDEGGSKKVYLCDDLKSGRRIIMAMLKVDDNPAKIEKFLKEARINAALQHPNIVPVYDVGMDGEKPWFTMKLIEGQTLQEKITDLSQGTCSQLKNLNARLEIFIKICQAVSYAHSKGVIHSDLKPQNVCISEFADVVVCDWGLADILPMECDEKLLELCTLTSEDISENQNCGVFEGTPGHASPEHAGVLKMKKTKSSDIFSLGTILYYLLTYEAPFKGADAMEIIKKTLICDFTDPSVLRPDLKIPKSVEAVCLKAMAPSPEERYASVEDLIRDLEAYRNGFMTEAEDASFAKALKLFVIRNRVKCLFSLALFFASLILLFVYFKNVKLAQKNAEQLAEKNRIEKEYYERINKESAPEFTQMAQNSFENFSVDNAYKFSKTATLVDPSLKRAWRVKGLSELAFNQFENAVSSFQEAGEKGFLLKLCGEYASKHANSKLAIGEYIKLILKLHNNGFQDIGHRLMHYKIYEEIPLEDRIIFCKAMLKLYNSYEKDFEFKYDPVTKTLDLSNNRWIKNIICLQNFPAVSMDLSRTDITNFLSFKSSPLKKLNVSHTRISQAGTLKNTNLEELDISNTAIPNLVLMKHLPLKVLNISNTPIRSMLQVRYYKKLKKLYLDKKQASNKNEISLIPNSVEVIVVK